VICEFAMRANLVLTWVTRRHPIEVIAPAAPRDP
jgi:hypothetical protein